MGRKSNSFYHKYKLTNTLSGEVFEGYGLRDTCERAGLSRMTSRASLDKSVKWLLETVSDPEKWDEATYRQHLYTKSKHKYPAYEEAKKLRDPLYEKRKQLRIRGWKNLDGTDFTAEQHCNLLVKECACCGSTERVVVDHCHTTNVVRGPLCNKCNLILGMVKDDVNHLEKLKQYLYNFTQRIHNEIY